jgi:hypothetical protein
MAYWGLDILVLALLIILLLIFIALPLYFTARLLDEDKGLLVALGTTILLVITFSICTSVFTWLGFCLIGFIIAVIVNLLIIKVIYDTEWGQAFVMWIVTIIMAIVITVVVFVIADLSIIALSGL